MTLPRLPRRVKAVPETVEAQAAICPAVLRVARDLPFDARAGHDCRKLSAQAALAACAFAGE